jgi:hypothetical protein
MPAGEAVAGRVVTSVDSPPLKMTSTTDRELPGLHFTRRQGAVKDWPADPEAAAFIGASVSIREVPEPQSSHASWRSKTWSRAVVRDRPLSNTDAVQGWPPL